MRPRQGAEFFFCRFFCGGGGGDWGEGEKRGLCVGGGGRGRVRGRGRNVTTPALQPTHSQRVHGAPSRGVLPRARHACRRGGGIKMPEADRGIEGGPERGEQKEQRRAGGRGGGCGRRGETKGGRGRGSGSLPSVLRMDPPKGRKGGKTGSGGSAEKVPRAGECRSRTALRKKVSGLWGVWFQDSCIFFFFPGRAAFFTICRHCPPSALRQTLNR